MSEATRYDTTRRTAGSPFDVQRLQVELRARGFDLRRVALLTYLLGAGSDRAMAYAVHARASREGWQASVYVDETGWVVRIVRTGLARPQQLSSDLSNIAAIAADFRVTMRGLIVEDAEPEDSWRALASGVRKAAQDQAREAQARRIPPQRAGDEIGEGRAAG